MGGKSREAQYEDGHAEDDDGLNRWYEKLDKTQNADAGKSSKSEGLRSSAFSVAPTPEASPMNGDENISARELLKIMFEQHEQT